MAVAVITRNTYTVDPLYQWDRNRTLEIRGLSLAVAPEIHFTNTTMSAAIACPADMDAAGIITVKIPNSLLQQHYPLYAYICVTEGEEFKTLYRLDIPVKERSKPDDYVTEEDEERFYRLVEMEREMAAILAMVDPETGVIMGEDGVTFTPSVAEDGTLSWTNDGDRENPEPVNVMGPVGPAGADGSPGPAGDPGAAGADGKDGVTFTPAIATDGTLSWSNDGERENPEPVNLMGPQGPAGDPGKDGQDGSPGVAGKDGSPGADGKDGATFTPNVAADGTLSWENDGGLENPAPRNLTGPKGADGVGISSVKIDSNGDLIITDTNGNESNAGYIGAVAPGYVITEAKEVADKVIASRTINSLVLLMASDIHVTHGSDVRTAIKNMGLGMKSIREYITPNAVVFLGDYVYDTTPLSKEQGIEDIKLAKKYASVATNGINTIWMNGNHDVYQSAADYADYRLSDDEVYSLIGSNTTDNAIVDQDNVGRNYGYIDFDRQRVRLVYLNTTDINGVDYSSHLISATQGQWLINTALDLSDKGTAEEKWGVIICTHIPAFSNPQLPAILGNFKDRASGTNFGISYDFSSAKAELIANFHGHIHNFKVTDMTTNAGNTLKCICIPNACPGHENPYATDEWCEVNENGDAVSYPKTADTAEETAFNAVVIDRDNQTIHAFCYGAGYDREISYAYIEPEIEIVNQLPISTDTNGAIYNGVGYADGVRLGSDGADRTGAAVDATGFIPCTYGDKLYLSGCQILKDGSATYQECACYTEDRTFIGKINLATASVSTVDDNGYVVAIDTSLFTSSVYSNMAFVRITGNYIGADSIITVNQPLE